MASSNLPHATMSSPKEPSNFRLIPNEMLTIVVSFGDVASNIRLAATCPWFRRFVYKKCPSAWKDIDFGKVPSSQAAKLTDIGLIKLLTNVNARRVTNFLSITGCTSIQGPGLSALMNSRCLEVIDLRKSHEDKVTCGETGLDEPYVIGVLSSMAPINTLLPYSSNRGLKLVKFRRQFDQANYYQSFNHEILNFLAILEDAIAQQMKERQVACEACESNLVACINDQHEFSYWASTYYCSACKSYKCGNRCETTVMDCHICMDQLCSDCQVVSGCLVCKKWFCSACRPVKCCEGCRRNICQECQATGSCPDCDSDFCTLCRPPQNCSDCEEVFCGECNPVTSCPRLWPPLLPRMQFSNASVERL